MSRASLDLYRAGVLGEGGGGPKAIRNWSDSCNTTEKCGLWFLNGSVRVCCVLWHVCVFVACMCILYRVHILVLDSR